MSQNSIMNSNINNNTSYLNDTIINKTSPPPGFEDFSHTLKGSVSNAINAALRPEAKAFVPATPSSLRVDAISFTPNMFDAPPPPPQTSPITAAAFSNIANRSAASPLASALDDKSQLAAAIASSNADAIDVTDCNTPMSPSRPFPTRQARAAAAAAGVFGPAAALASPRNKKKGAATTTAANSNLTPSDFGMIDVFNVNRTPRGAATSRNMLQSNPPANIKMTTPKIAHGLSSIKDAPAATLNELLSLIDVLKASGEDKPSTPVSLSRLQVQKLIYDLIAACCDAQGSRWERDEDLAELETEIKQSTAGAALEEALAAMSIHVQQQQQQPLNVINQHACSATAINNLSNLASNNSRFQSFECVSDDEECEDLEDANALLSPCDETMSLRKKLRKKEKKEMKKRKKLILKEIERSLSDHSSLMGGSLTPLSIASPSNAAAALAAVVVTTPQVASRPTAAELLAKILSDEELDIKRQDLRNRSVGLLVSAIKTEWSRRYGPSIPLGFHMKALDYKKLKFLLEEVPNLVVIGSGGFMRVATVEHAMQFARPYPPHGVDADGKSPVLSVVTPSSDYQCFQIDTLKSLNAFELKVKAEIACHTTTIDKTESSTKLPAVSSILSPSNNCNNEDIIANAEPELVVRVVSEILSDISPRLSHSPSPVSFLPNTSTSSGLTIPSISSKQMSSNSPSTLNSLASGRSLSSSLTLEDVSMIARAAGLTAAAVTAQQEKKAASVKSLPPPTPSSAANIPVVANILNESVVLSKQQNISTTATAGANNSVKQHPLEQLNLSMDIKEKQEDEKKPRDAQPLNMQVRRLLFGLINEASKIEKETGGCVSQSDREVEAAEAPWLSAASASTEMTSMTCEEFATVASHAIPLCAIPRLWVEVLRLKSLANVMCKNAENDTLSVLDLLASCNGVSAVKREPDGTIFIVVEASVSNIPSFSCAPTATPASSKTLSAISPSNANKFNLSPNPSAMSPVVCNAPITPSTAIRSSNTTIPALFSANSPVPSTAAFRLQATSPLPSTVPSRRRSNGAITAPPPPPPPPSVSTPSQQPPSPQEVRAALQLLQHAQAQQAKAIEILTMANASGVVYDGSPALLVGNSFFAPAQLASNNSPRVVPPPPGFAPMGAISSETTSLVPPLLPPAPVMAAPTVEEIRRQQADMKMGLPPGLATQPAIMKYQMDQFDTGCDSPKSESSDFLPPGLNIKSTSSSNKMLEDNATTTTSTSTPIIEQNAKLSLLIMNAKRFKTQQQQQQQFSQQKYSNNNLNQQQDKKHNMNTTVNSNNQCAGFKMTTIGANSKSNNSNINRFNNNLQKISGNALNPNINGNAQQNGTTGIRTPRRVVQQQQQY